MASPYAEHVKTPTPQSEPIPGREKEMIQNAAGGFVFQIDDWMRLRRFLVLGTEGGTYYEGERKLTLENAACVARCVAADGPRAVDLIVDVSDKGLAIKNDPAVFALAIASVKGDALTRKRALEALPKVCRIGTHLFQFAEARQALGGGWGRGLRAAVAKWYTGRERKDVVLQALKYQQRDGWSHRDLLRLAHPTTGDEQLRKVFDAICRPAKWAEVDDHLALGWRALQEPNVTAGDAAKIIEAHRLPRECVPTQFLNEAKVWAALLPHMPLTALMRNLGNLSKCGLLTPLSDAAAIVSVKLRDAQQLHKSRLHPFAVLVATKVYGSGHGVRGSGEWVVVPQVLDALDEAFELAFHNVAPTGKRHLLGVDISGSMSSSMGANGVISAAEAAAAMALVTARSEPNYYVMGFSTQFVDLGITAKDSLGDVLSKTRNRNFGGTNTSVAIEWATKHKVPVDVFEILTDNETWAGDRHTCQALQAYRRATGLATKLAVVGFTATARSVADGGDPGSMDFVGMDASLPQALAAFVTE